MSLLKSRASILRIVIAAAVGVVLCSDQSALIGKAGAEPAPSGPNALADPGRTAGRARPDRIAALGRIEPQGEVLEVGTPLVDRIDKLLVKVGDRVETGQPLVNLGSHAVRTSEKKEIEASLAEAVARREAEMQYAKSIVLEAELRLRRLKELLPLDIAAQKKRVEQLQAQSAAQASYGQALVKESQARVDQLELTTKLDIGTQETQVQELKKRLAAEAKHYQSLIVQAQARLENTTLVLPLNIQAQQAIVRQAAAELELTKKNLARVKAMELKTAIAQQEIDEHELGVTKAQEALKQAEATLAGMVISLQTGLASAKADVAAAEAQLVSITCELQAESATALSLLTKLKKAREVDLLAARAGLTRSKAGSARAQSEIQVELASSKPALEKLEKSLELDTLFAEAQLSTAKANLARAGAAHGVESLKQRLLTAEAELSRTVLRAPGDGEVLEICQRPGEVTGAGPVLKLGNTEEMYAVAEVYETDVRFVKPGQKATITSPAFEGQLEGTVDQVGRLVAKNDVLSVDPTANTDARVVEVRIRLTQGESVSGLTNLQVNVFINLTE